MDPKIIELTRQDPRYAYEAYDFACEAVTYTQQLLGRCSDEDSDEEVDHHVSGAELLRGACALAVRDFGMMAPIVFKLWGIHSTDDFGELVFALIRVEKLSKSEQDDPEDFHDLFDLDQELSSGFELTTSAYPGRKGD